MSDEGTAKNQVEEPTQTGEGQAPGSNGSGAEFSQDDLNRVAGKARKEALARFAKEQGLADVADLEALIAQKRQAEEQAKTELDRAQEQATAAQQRMQAMEQQMRSNLLRAEFRVQAAAQVADVDLAYLAAREAGYLDDDLVNLETGTVTGVDAIVEKLLVEKPILKKQTPARAAGTGGAESGNGSGAGVSANSIRARFGI